MRRPIKSISAESRDRVCVVSVGEAKSALGLLLDALDGGRARQVVITRRGRPAARLVPYDRGTGGIRLGVAIGKFELPDDSGTCDAEVSILFRSAED